MITDDIAVFLDFARHCAADFGPATARAAFLVSPDGFARAEQSAADNRYMAQAAQFDTVRALQQHRELHRQLSTELPVVVFPGDPATPDSVFPNNVFATVRGRLLVGRMRHPVRQREAQRQDIRGFFHDLLGYALEDLSLQPHPCELTGSLVIDRARGLGLCGLSERCDRAGAERMHRAFGLRATLVFDLAPGEYHANVVLEVLAGRALVASPRGFAQPQVAEALAGFYAPHASLLDPVEQQAFAANAIALGPHRTWMSAVAERALAAPTRAMLERAGLPPTGVELDAIEVAGGSLRCCVAEIF